MSIGTIDQIKNLANSATTSITAKLSDFGLSAKDLTDLNISDIAKSLPNTASNFISSTAKKSETLTNITSKVNDLANKNNQEFSTLSKSIAKQVNDASKNVTFVTSATKQSIGNVDLPFGSSGLNLDKASANTLKKIQEISGTDGTNALETAKSARSAIADVLTSAKSKGANLLKSGRDIAASVYKPVASVTNDITGYTNVNNWKRMVAENTKFLPSSLQKVVNQKAFSKLNELSTKTKSISNITSGIDNITGKMANLNNFGSVYSLITDPTGNKKYGFSNGNLGLDILGDMYNDASRLCPNAKMTDLYEYGSYKDLYDLLINESIDKQMADLLRKMLNCDSSTKFDDKRTVSILANGMETAANNGDPFTINAIFDSQKLNLDSVKNAEKIPLSYLLIYLILTM